MGVPSAIEGHRSAAGRADQVPRSRPVRRLARIRQNVALVNEPRNQPVSFKDLLQMVTAGQKSLVQDSFVDIATIADDAAVLFYQRLFELDPSLRPMFRGDMKEQRKKLMQMLTAAVKGLDHLDRLVPVVRDLGRRHAAYGVMDSHYDTVAEALLWTLDGARSRLHAPGQGRVGRRLHVAGDDHEGCG